MEKEDMVHIDIAADARKIHKIVKEALLLNFGKVQGQALVIGLLAVIMESAHACDIKTDIILDMITHYLHGIDEQIKAFENSQEKNT